MAKHILVCFYAPQCIVHKIMQTVLYIPISQSVAGSIHGQYSEHAIVDYCPNYDYSTYIVTVQADHEYDDVPDEELRSSRSLGGTAEPGTLQRLGARDLADDLVPDVDELMQAPFLFAADLLGDDRAHHRRTFHQLQLRRLALAHQRHRQVLK